MKTIFSISTIAAMLFAVESCTKSEIENVKPVSDKEFRSEAGSLSSKNAYAITPRQDIIDAYLDRHIFSFRVRLFTGPAGKELVAQTPVANNLFVYEAKQMLELEGKKFVSITDAKEPTHGPQVVWHEYMIQFGRGYAPRQFFSVQELAAAIADSHGELTVAETGNVYQGQLFMPSIAPAGAVAGN